MRDVVPGPFGARPPAVRRLGPGLGGEAPRLAALHAAAFTGLSRAWSAAEIERLAAGPGVAVLAGAHGFAMLRTAHDEAELLTLAVHPGHRRAGLGAALLRAGLRAARADGAARMLLEVAADNAPALALYAAQGFGEVARRLAYYPRPGAPAADALVLARPLAARPAAG